MDAASPSGGDGRARRTAQRSTHTSEPATPRERAPGGSKREHFCGSTVSRMDVDVDAGIVAVGTYAGVVHLLALEGDPGPYAIGRAPLRELRRHVFWPRAEPLPG